MSLASSTSFKKGHTAKSLKIKLQSFAKMIYRMQSIKYKDDIALSTRMTLHFDIYSSCKKLTKINGRCLLGFSSFMNSTDKSFAISGVIKMFLIAAT